MGIELVWEKAVLLELEKIGVMPVPAGHEKYRLLLGDDKVAIHLIPLNNDYNPQELIELQAFWQLKGITLVQLWEDVWQSKRIQVLGRIRSILGLNKRLHGRKGTIVKITQHQADDFLNANHIQGSARARYKIALCIEGQMVAVACFSNIRFMKNNSTGYRSVELIRFATLIGFTVTGGFTKLLKHIIEAVKPDDVMSYADRDWSLGNAYKQSGFKLIDVTPPAQIWVRREDLCRFFSHRLPVADHIGLAQDAEVNADSEFLSVFNTGNLKYILYLK